MTLIKIQRTRNATRNIFYGGIYRVVATVGPFLTRTMLIYILGIEYLGLHSLFTSLLNILALTEMGIGSAMVFEMYKPIAEDDEKTISALLNLYKSLYRIIGIIILCIGIALIPVLNRFISGDIPDGINIYILYFVYLTHTVLNYFLFGYKQSLLLAFQRNDVFSKVSLLMRIVMYGSQVIILLCTKNYYAYIVMLPIYTLGVNLICSLCVDRMFPRYHCIGEVDPEQKRRIMYNVAALFGNKLSDTMLNFSDNVVLSAFCGLTMVAMFDNYFYVFSAVVEMMIIIYKSMTAGIGNSIATESLGKNYSDFQLLTFINFWVTTWASVCLLCLIQPFISIWVGDQYRFSSLFSILFAVYFFTFCSERIVLTYKDAAGMWREDRIRPYVVIGLNLILNIYSVQKYGVYGIVCSTIISLLISIPWSGHVVVSSLFNKSLSSYLLNLLKAFFIAVIIGTVTYVISDFLSPKGIVGFVIRALICCVIPNVLIILANIKNPNLNKSISMLKRGIKRFL